MTFGQAGDRPVTGDWNGDGVTDLGVVRGNEWILTLGPVPALGSAPAVWRDVTFGGPDRRPGHRRLGRRRHHGARHGEGRRWLLAPSVDDLAGATTVSYGSPGDTPVVGDWDGDGADGLGVVRGEHLVPQQHRRQAHGGPHHHPRAPYVRHPGHLAGARASRYGDLPDPDAQRRARGRELGRAQPRARPSRSPPTTARRVGSRRSLESSERYLLGAQYHALWRPTRLHSYLSLLGGKSDELAVRLPAMSALTVAIGLRTDAYDPAVVGRSTTTRDARTSASSSGRSRASTSRCRPVAGDRAGRPATGPCSPAPRPGWSGTSSRSRPAPTWSRCSSPRPTDRPRSPFPTGACPTARSSRPGDTKAEECSWNAGLLVPRGRDDAVGSARRDLAGEGRRARGGGVLRAGGPDVARPWSTASRSRAGCRASTPTTTARSRTTTGIHPDYAANVQLLWLDADFDRLARQRVPEAMFHDGGLVYSALSTRSFQAGAASPAGGAFAAPGGTATCRGTNDDLLPTGRRLGRRTPGPLRQPRRPRPRLRAVPRRHRLAGRRGARPARERAARAWWRRAAPTTAAPTPSIPTVAATQDTYPGREEYAAQSLASAWLALYVRQIGVPGARQQHAGGARSPPSQAPHAPAAAAPLAPVSGGPALVVGAAIVRDGRVLAARRTTPPGAAGRWELPGGKVEPGESPDEAARPGDPRGARAA